MASARYALTNAPCLYVKYQPKHGSIEPKHVANYVLIKYNVLCLNKLLYHINCCYSHILNCSLSLNVPHRKHNLSPLKRTITNKCMQAFT
jgi:hypothetical protein